MAWHTGEAVHNRPSTGRSHPAPVDMRGRYDGETVPEYPTGADRAPERFVPAGDINPVLTAADVTDFGRTDCVADPFLFVTADGDWHMFFEVYTQNRQPSAVIGHAESTDGYDWSYDRVVLEADEHLSYPYVFKWEGDHYMVPDTWAKERGPAAITLYKAESFPYGWEPVAGSSARRPRFTTSARSGGRTAGGRSPGTARISTRTTATTSTRPTGRPTRRTPSSGTDRRRPARAVGRSCSPTVSSRSIRTVRTGTASASTPTRSPNSHRRRTPTVHATTPRCSSRPGARLEQRRGPPGRPVVRRRRLPVCGRRERRYRLPVGGDPPLGDRDLPRLGSSRGVGSVAVRPSRKPIP
ncbi:hypothetical protein ACFQRB_19535 [Halobaculum litoreum]|uniref:Glucosamine inositolphosphorylceramide transferase 1 N-terminal domain-containing protein n=1 Tax=Halobaculum litoreum TaxID=3031998 RepID=A0ABD5XWM4_9EURY